MLDGVVAFVFNLVFPKAPKWIGTLLTTAVPAVIELVEAVDDAADKSGSEKFRVVVDEVRDLLDESLDAIPEWDDYPEESRDRIIGGMTELAVFVHKLAENDSPKAARRKVRKALKKIG
jgi:hypothetical protein